MWETWLAGKKRGISCDIELDANNRSQLVGVHLSHRSEQLRAASAKLLVEMASKSERPMIVVGDLNSTPPGFPETQVAEDGENAMAVFAADGRLRRYSTPLPVSSADMTFHSTKPRRIIDWILIPSECRFKDYRVVASTLSDHRPVVATIEINNRERND